MMITRQEFRCPLGTLVITSKTLHDSFHIAHGFLIPNKVASVLKVLSASLVYLIQDETLKVFVVKTLSFDGDLIENHLVGDDVDAVHCRAERLHEESVQRSREKRDVLELRMRMHDA